MGLGRCVVTHIICTIMQKKKFHALWSLKRNHTTASLALIGFQNHTTYAILLPTTSLMQLRGKVTAE